jgi:WhiB family redox-sensing transcriptional regulator
MPFTKIEPSVDEDDQKWFADGACREHPTDLWFSVRPTDIMRANVVCDGCLVRTECLAHALARPAMLGMWAGTTPADRVAIRRER